MQNKDYCSSLLPKTPADSSMEDEEEPKTDFDSIAMDIDEGMGINTNEGKKNIIN